MERALPAAPVDGLEALAAFLHALESAAFLRTVPRVQVVLQGSSAALSVEALVFPILRHAIVVQEVVLEAYRNPVVLRHPGVSCVGRNRLLYVY